MSKVYFLVPVAIIGGIGGIGGFVAFWCLVVKMLSLVGWQRLAQYRLPRPLGWPTRTIGRATVGGISYKNVLSAGAQAEGLTLEVLFLFRVGHPPLLIPWAAIGPVRTEKFLWTTTYATEISTSGGGTVRFTFSRDQLARDIEAWRQTAGPPPAGLTRY
ncbi:hypothetical protein Q5H92_05805 [Hymenobacter sp. M29]|uniref:DUF304 domain-containing protein n=1 Tax=Hymenobacter mellowenesis TaxID=3063995 RepID=A0ABT9A7P3_9BACT|nr:hypothetical protein [Hymenobacter sp. M29]MDO7845863.1 hypothetical protein [Hymenobacter sp. M29]